MRTRDPLKARAIVDSLFPSFPEKDNQRLAKRLEQMFKNEQLAPYLTRERIENNRMGSNKTLADCYRVKQEYKTLVSNLILLDTLTHDRSAALKLILGDSKDQNVTDHLDRLLNDFSFRMQLYKSAIGLIHNLKDQSEQNPIDFKSTRLDQLMGASFDRSYQSGVQIKSTPVELHALRVLEEVEKAIDYDPDNIEDMIEKARYYIKIEQARPAYDLLRAVIAKEANHSVALMLLAQVHLTFKDQLAHQASHYELMHEESEPCSAAERHYDEMASETICRAIDEREQAFNLLAKALKYWPLSTSKWRKGYEEESLRDHAKRHLIHLAAMKCDPETQYDDKLLARLDLYVESKIKYRVKFSPVDFEGYESVKHSEPTDEELHFEAAELKAKPFFDEEKDKVILTLAKELFNSRGTFSQSKSQRIVELIDAMMVLQALTPDHSKELFPSFLEGLQELTKDNPESLNCLMTYRNGYGLSLRRQMLAVSGKSDAFSFIDQELIRSSEKQQKDAARIKLLILEHLSQNLYKLHRYEECYHCCIEAEPLIEPAYYKEDSNWLNIQKASWVYKAVRSYIDETIKRSLNGENISARAISFLDRHSSHIEYLIQCNRAYMHQNGGGDFETGYDQWEEDPFGQQEDDIFATNYDGKCLFRDFIQELSQHSDNPELHNRLQGLLLLLDCSQKAPYQYQ